MNHKIWLAVLVAFAAVTCIAPGAIAAGKLLCVSNSAYKGEQTVGACLAKGDEFAIVDQYGIVHILSKREVELTKAFNPKLFEQKAYSLQYQELAPEMKIFGYTVRPAQPKK